MKNKIQRAIYILLPCVLIQLMLVLNVSAQEAGYFNHQFLHPVLINPGATGFDENHQVLASYKHNYSDFEDAPRTFTALYHGSFADKIGLGVQLLTDRVGVNRLFHGQINYAYRFIFSNAKISVGLSTGLQNFKVTGLDNDPIHDPTDPLL